MAITPFILGFLSSLCASVAFVLISQHIRRAKARPIEEYWLEDMPELGERRLSIGRLYFHRWSSSYCYDGTSYSGQGDIYYRWRSTMLNVMLSSHRIAYFYELQYRDRAESHREGFGVISFEESDKGIVLSHGYFVDCEDTTKPVNHTLMPLSRVVEALGIKQRGDENLAEYHRRIVLEAYGKGLPRGAT